MPTADELRNVAQYLEETSAEVTSAAQTNAPAQDQKKIAGLQWFPREAPQERALYLEPGALQAETERAIATLHELAAALDAGMEASPVMFVPVQPYIDAYHEAQG